MLEAYAPTTMSMFRNYNMATTEVKFNIGSCLELRKDKPITTHQRNVFVKFLSSEE